MFLSTFLSNECIHGETKGKYYQYYYDIVNIISEKQSEGFKKLGFMYLIKFYSHTVANAARL